MDGEQHQDVQKELDELSLAQATQAAATVGITSTMTAGAIANETRSL